MSTYTPIASITLTGNAASLTFSSIPQNYTDLILVASGRRDTGGPADHLVRFNGDSGTNYSRTYIYGDGSNIGSGRDVSDTSAKLMYFDSSTFSTPILHIMNYSNASVFKTIVQKQTLQSVVSAVNVATWRSNNAINQISIIAPSNNILAGSTFNLYGIADATWTNVAKATGGDSVYTDGTYWYHTFLTSGIFTPNQNITADYLVVAGGGGGGCNTGAGGGGGGLRSTVTATGGGGSLENAVSLTASTGYRITVGAGGAGSTDTANGGIGRNGNGSSISGSGLTTILSAGGGGGGANILGVCISGNVGGSGGGGGGGNSGSAAGAAGTANQGYAGGLGTGPDANQSGGGGGGAGAVGAAANSSTGQAGTGGNGVATVISGSSVTYAGGGGGGSRGGRTNAAGGTGGGGSGKAANTATAGDNGTANLGGGGGGGSTFAGTGGNGGSGIVIVRYAV